MNNRLGKTYPVEQGTIGTYNLAHPHRGTPRSRLGSFTLPRPNRTIHQPTQNFRDPMPEPTPLTKATVVVETYLKRQLAPAGSLAPADRVKLPAGTVIQVRDHSTEKNQHHWLQLDQPIVAEDGKSKLDEVYVYDPHIQVDGERLILRLPVTYRSQMDNNPKWHGAPNRQCNVTSTVMLLDYILKGKLSKLSSEAGFREPEGYYGKILRQKYDSDTTDHDGHTVCLKEEFNVDSYWSKKLSARDIRRQLELGIPVVIGVAFKVSGHILCIVGIDESRGTYLVHDPYGIRYGASNSYDVGAWGAYDVYSIDVMDQLFWDGGPESGWGRVITAIDGKTTGMPDRL
jgi:Peptidase_C39 like family